MGLFLKIKFRSSRSQMFFKIAVLKDFVNFTGKHLWWSIFCESYRLSELQLFWKETLVKFTKFLRTPCVTEHRQCLLLTVSIFQPATFLNKRFQQRCFSVNLAKFLRTCFVITPPDDCFSGWLLCLSVNFEKFFRTPLL